MHIKYLADNLIMFYIHKHTTSFSKTEIMLEALYAPQCQPMGWLPIRQVLAQAEIAGLPSGQQGACCTTYCHQTAGLYQKSHAMEFFFSPSLFSFPAPKEYFISLYYYKLFTFLSQTRLRACPG